MAAATAGPATPITPQTAELAANARLTRCPGNTRETAAVPVARIRPPPRPWRRRSTMRISMLGAKAMPKPVAVKMATEIRNIRLTPRESMNGPASTVASDEVSRYEVTTQGRRATLPRSVAMSGSAAATPRDSNEARAAVEKMAREAGRSSLEKMLGGWLIGPPAYACPRPHLHRSGAGSERCGWVAAPGLGGTRPGAEVQATRRRDHPMTAPMRNSTRAMISTHLRASTKSPTPPRISARISSTAIHIGAPFVQRTPITRRYRPQNAPTRIPQEPGLVPHDRREWGKAPRPERSGGWGRGYQAPMLKPVRWAPSSDSCQ